MSIIQDMSEYSPEFFASWLKRKRKRHGMSLEDLARKVGVSRSYLSALERSHVQLLTNKATQPALDKVEAIARALGEDVDEARIVAGYAPFTGPDPTGVEYEGVFKGYEKLSPQMQEIARRQIKMIIDSLSEDDEFDYDYIDDPADKK